MTGIELDAITEIEFLGHMTHAEIEDMGGILVGCDITQGRVYRKMHSDGITDGQICFRGVMPVFETVTIGTGMLGSEVITELQIGLIEDGLSIVESQRIARTIVASIIITVVIAVAQGLKIIGGKVSDR